MFRVALFSLAVAMILSWVPISAQTEKETKEPEKKEEKILGKTVGEWIVILRTHDNPKWRRAALLALDASNAAHSTGLPAVLAAVEKDKEPMIRQEAVMLVGRLGPKVNGATKALAAALQTDKDDSVREAAATALGKEEFKDQAVDYLAVLIDGLKDPHAGTRGAVATTLRNLGKSAEPAFPALFEAAKNPKETLIVRSAAVHTLSRNAKEDPKLVPLLLDLLKSSDTALGLREAAAEGLGRSDIDSADVVTLLCQTLTNKSIELRKASAISLGSLGVKAKAGWPTIKGRIKYEAKDGSFTPVEADSSVRNHLIRLTGTLGKTNPEAIAALTDAAKVDGSTENRIAAIQELAEIGPLAKAAVPALERIAEEDARAPVRDAAAKAVKLISK